MYSQQQMPQYNTAARPGGAPPGGAPPGGAPPGGAPPGAPYASHAAPTWHQQYAAQVSPAEMQQMQQWFASVDADRSGQIDARELHQALSMGGNTFGMDVIGRLIQAFDMDNSGQIGLQEFIAMHKYLASLRDAFQFFDRDRSGTLDLNELQQALQRAGFMLSPQAFYAMMPKFDKMRAARLTFDQWLDLCIWLGNMRKLMGFYDPRGSGFVTLSFDQLVAITPYYQ